MEYRLNYCLGTYCAGNERCIIPVGRVKIRTFKDPDCIVFLLRKSFEKLDKTPFIINLGRVSSSGNSIWKRIHTLSSGREDILEIGNR